jgi:hypothetical protein
MMSDPRPEIVQDTNLWNKLFRLIDNMNDRDKAMKLSARLWTVRSAGTLLRPSTDGLKFVPLLDDRGAWEDQAFFDEIKKKYLAPYKDDIEHLLKAVMKR